MTPETNLPPETPADTLAVEGLESTPYSLFIGGHADGQRMTIERDALTIRVPRPDRETHDYRAEKLGTPGKTWIIYVWDQITIEDVMDLLISNYPAKKHFEQH